MKRMAAVSIDVEDVNAKGRRSWEGDEQCSGGGEKGSRGDKQC